MEIDKDLDLKLNEVFDTLDQIDEIKVSSSFKQNVLNRIEEKTEKEVIFRWFTPKLQLVVMVIVLLVNVSAIVYSFSSSTDITDINGFAEAYNLTTTTTSILNN